MRISRKVSIAVAFILFASVASIIVSGVMLAKLREEESRIADLNVAFRGITNLIISSNLSNEPTSNRVYFENIISETKHSLEAVKDKSEAFDKDYIDRLITNVDFFTELYSEMLASKENIKSMDDAVHRSILALSVDSFEMQERVHSLLQGITADNQLESPSSIDSNFDLRSTQKFLYENSLVWGWLNRAMGIINRKLLVYREIPRFQVNFEVARYNYEKSITAIIEISEYLRIDGLDRYAEKLGRIKLDMAELSADFSEASKSELNATNRLRDYGEFLRTYMRRIINQSEEIAKNQIASISLFYWVASILLLLGSLATAFWLSLSITRPLRQLARNFKFVSGGNFKLKIPADGESEIDDLARAFNEMTMRLEKSYSAVEAQVKQRTEELELTTLRAKKLATIAQAANMEKSTFLATMSHEIRTPLNSIIGFSEMLVGSDLNEEQKEDLLAIRSSGLVLLELINDILDLSKIEAGHFNFDCSSVNILDLSEELCSLFELPCREKNLEINCEVIGDLEGVEISTDRTRLYQLLNNLLGNAVKFTHSGSIKLKVWVEENDEPMQELYYFSVEDTGIGIPEEKLDEIFEPFTQADSSTTRKYGGTGLGLAISNRIVALLGGALSVESSEGQGSVFTFHIKSQGELEVLPEPENSEPDELLFAQNLNVLLVEDDPTNYRLSQKLLNTFGIEPQWAQNGREAVELVRKTDFDLILMDLQMPVLDGLEATYEIRVVCANRSQPYISALTANALQESRDACDSAGMQDFITKPITRDSMLQALLRFKQSSDL